MHLDNHTHCARLKSDQVVSCVIIRKGVFRWLIGYCGWINDEQCYKSKWIFKKRIWEYT